MAKSRISKKSVIPSKRKQPEKIPQTIGLNSKPIKGLKKPLQADKLHNSMNGFPIVGIGASAGGLEAFKQLLVALPIDTGMAFIFVQHLDPTHESLAPEIFARSTRMPVHEVEDGMRALPNHVYIIPPNFNMALFHGELSLLPRKEPRGQPMTIDTFFQSLAQDQKGRAVGVVLSGTASDGRQGIMAIKSEGGLVIVQDPKSAKYDGMPNSAIASGVVDLILPPKGIALELARISKHPYIGAACEAKRHPHSAEDVESQPDAALRKIFRLLRTHTHVDFSNYKHATLKRRIERRMMVRKTDTLGAYAKYLEDNNDEIKALYADILINVTEFFRDPDSFKALTEDVFPQLMKNRAAGAPIRIWVPGCSTGEEVYSLAMILLEYLGDEGAKTPIQIFATDISESAIQKARAGMYAEGIEAAVSKERLTRFFDKVEAGYKIKKGLRDLCLYSRHDVTRDPPFAKLDLVSCRNVLIYFTAVLQKRVIPIFHYALNSGGFLWLGRSESPDGSSKLFTLMSKTHKIFSKNNIPTPMRFHFPVSEYVPEVTEITTRGAERGKDAADFQSDADRIALSKYAPPSVVVNADMEILQFRGRTVPYLEPASGLPSNNLLKMARQELQHDLRVTIHAATKQNLPARREGLSFEVDGKRRTVNIEVVPANPLAPPRQRNFVIFFEETSSPPAPNPRQGHLPVKRGAKKGSSGNIQDLQNQQISQLEQNVSAGQKYQQSMAEDFESTKEELTAANEELQSANEELQSTNEELETAKEELQSSNEELTTVNDEMQIRNSDLLTLSSDLDNLLTSVEIPILIVGNDHRIRKFTPKAEGVFKLIPSDVGRLIGDIRANFDLDLDALVSEVSKTLRSQEIEIQDHQGKWMRLQIRPYKTIDNRIGGAVITLMDIEALKQQIKIAKKAQDYLTSVSETVRLPLVILDDQLRLRSANNAFWDHFKLSQKITGKDFFAILEMKEASLQEMRKLLSETLRVNKKVKNIEMDLEFPHLGRRTILISASLIQWMGEVFKEPEEPEAILLSFDDITERRRIEKNLARESKNVRLFEVVTVAANEATSIDGTLQIFLDEICAHASWPVGHVYLAKRGAPGEFISASVWHLDDPKKFGRFKEGTELLNLPFGAGLPGKVFATGKSVATRDLSHDLVSQKARFAEEVGLKSGLGFPVFVGGSIVAVLEFFSTENREPEQRLIEVITHVVPQLGQVFERKGSAEGLALLMSSEQEARVDAEGANQTKDEFLATLSHELRTPLTSILSWSQLIQKQKFDPDKLKHGIKMIEQSAKMQGQLIDDLLDVTRIRSGKLSITFSEIDPREPVSVAMEAVHPLAENKRIVIESDIKTRSEKIWGDRGRLQQIVWNLLTNAIKFSTDGGLIRVRVEQVEEHGDRFVMIKVIDQGKGILPEFLPRLFDRFSQVDSSSIRVHGGLGLGLAIVRDLVTLQSGTVRAESEGIGKGATFTVLFPIKSGAGGLANEIALPVENKIQENVEPANLSGLSVMVVDDDPSALEVVSEALNSFGAKTLSCSTVAEALAAFEKFSPSVLVSDISMPGEDGYSLIRKIRKLGADRCGDVPSLALTAYATVGDVKRALLAGFDSHMAKPFDTFHLGRLVAELAARKSSPVREKEHK